MISLKAVKIILCMMMIASCFGIALIDKITPGASWKTPILGVLYGTANIVIFMCKD